MSDDAFTILVVEDDDATRTFLADNLTADGYELLVTASVDEGRRLLERQFPDLVLVDVGLPDGSGLGSSGRSARPTGRRAASTRRPRCSS